MLDAVENLTLESEVVSSDVNLDGQQVCLLFQKTIEQVSYGGAYTGTSNG